MNDCDCLIGDHYLLMSDSDKVHKTMVMACFEYYGQRSLGIEIGKQTAMSDWRNGMSFQQVFGKG